MTDQTAITLSNGATTFTGDAIQVYGVKSLRSGIKLHKACGMIPSRGVTITKMLATATRITGKPYKGATKHDAAIADLTVWIDAAMASMPILDKRG